MKIQEDPTELLDVPATHLSCIEEDTEFDLKEMGFDIESRPIDSIADLRCPNEGDGEDHPIELMHVSETPLASPSGRKDETVLAGTPWVGLDPFDEEHYHFGNKRFEYNLEEN